jgi:O-antigen ligase
MSQKIYLYILKFGVYLSLLTVFFVFKSLLFPYITSKQISFNILIEVLFIFWLALIIKYPQYRPRKFWISYGLIGFFAALFLSCLVSVDFNLSFWGDVERMLGVFHLLHFLAFYFIIITVFREWRDWKFLFIISIIFAVFVSYVSITGEKSWSTIGNSAYVAGYIIFNIYFALLLFFKESNKVFKWLYLIPIPIMMLAFKRCGISGAFVGLGTSIIVLFFLYALFSKNKKIKIITLAIGLLIVLFTGLIFTNRDSDWVKNTPFISAAQGITFQKRTFQTRLISWRAAAKDFKNHPILGTGHGNYAITFDKYFEPTFYDYTRSETYFDRAHNNLVDIGSTTGSLGLLTYLAIFIAVAYYLIKGYREEKINLHEFVLLTCLIIAYFIQNLAVFDSLVTYMGIMIVLGYIYWLNREEEEREVARERGLENKEIYILAGVGLLIFVIMYQYNIKPLKMLVGTIDGQRAYAQGDIIKTIDTYKKALSYKTILDRDSRTSLNRLFVSGSDRLKQFGQEKGQEILDYNIELAEANVKYNPSDSLNQMVLAQILNNTASYNSGNPEKFGYYSDRSLDTIDKAIAVSPGRVPIYFQKAQIYITRGDKDKAIETLKYAVSLNEKYYDSSCHLAKVLFFYKDAEEGYKYMDQCIDLGGASLLAPANTVKSLVNYYVEQEDWPKVISLYQRLTELERQEAKHWINLAKLYAQTGDKEKAREAAERAGEIDSSIKNYAEEFIGGLE